MESTDEELFNEFGEALDEWAREVKQACRASAVQQKQLANRLTEPTKGRKVDQSRVSKWLSGRKIVTTGGAALPGKGLSQDIIRALGLQGAPAQRVMRLGERIDLVQAQLERRYPSGWRVAAQAHFRDSSAVVSSPAGAEAESSSGATSLAPPPAVSGHRQDTPDAPQTPAAHATAAAPPSAAAVDEETAALPPLITGSASPEARRHGWLRRPWHDQPGWVKAMGSAAILVAAVLVTAAVVGADGDEKAGGQSQGAAPQTSAPAGESSSAQGGPGAVASEFPGVEKGTLGEDSRCSVPFAGPGAVTWRVCARVETERVSFALKITNHGSKAATVKARLEYAHHNEFYPCPKAPSAHPVDVAAGQTVITDSGQCAVAREETYVAYQGVGWVVAEDANAGSYKLSPTAHIHPDRVIWQPDLM
ncbi:hypothetical protein [Streptomyces flaveolus]|uniref:hypothetical protein n=1 Tax=Streptomyces flaveolus TaxID=67297 RepID=UPI003806DD78